MTASFIRYMETGKLVQGCLTMYAGWCILLLSKVVPGSSIVMRCIENAFM